MASELDYFKRDLDGAIGERTLALGSEMDVEIKKFYAAQLAILIDIKDTIETRKYRKLSSPPKTREELTAFQKRWLKIWGYPKPQWNKNLDPELVRSLEKSAHSAGPSRGRKPSGGVIHPTRTGGRRGGKVRK